MLERSFHIFFCEKITFTRAFETVRFYSPVRFTMEQHFLKLSLVIEYTTLKGFKIYNTYARATGVSNGMIAN